ncbi:MAG: anti-sigma factor [Rhodocyclaceae bacterium]|nr:MAG: anti-sigma factor [Rhodocyclaceae bacterium]
MIRPAEEDFHAYADGALTEIERQHVETWLAAHPEDAALVKGWRDQGVALHRLFDPILAEAVPERLTRTVMGDEGKGWRVAAALGWLSLGVLVGYGLRGVGPDRASTLATLVHPAAIAHAAFVPEVRHPVEVGAEQEGHLVQWLSKRLGTPVLAPNLKPAGFQLLGGRLLPGEGAPAAQFMYQDGAGRRVTLYVRKGVADSKETAFRFAQEKNVSVFYWVDGQAGYALSGELPRQELMVLADAAYRDLERQDAK